MCGSDPGEDLSLFLVKLVHIRLGFRAAWFLRERKYGQEMDVFLFGHN
jgi:hypothetical protein